jgi:hypothetical protein
MFDYLPHIDLHKPESIGDHVSSYLGVTHTPDKDGNLTDLYNSSATCVSPNRGLVGEAARMISGLRRTLELGYDKIRRRRQDPNIENHKELCIHEKMAYPGAKYFFITAARYPVISSQCLRNKTKVLAVLAEGPLMILLGTICKGKKQLPQRTSLKQVAMMCQDISANLRPQGMPQPQWGGTNKLLPIFQSSRPVWELLIDTDAAQWAKPRKILREFWHQTNERRLSGAKCEEILVAAGLGITASLKTAVRGFYRGILDEHVQVYEGRYYKWLKKLAILWWQSFNKPKVWALSAVLTTVSTRWRKVVSIGVVYLSWRGGGHPPISASYTPSKAA